MFFLRHFRRFKSKKEYDVDENGKRIKLPSGEYKSHKVNTCDWNNKVNCEKWRQVWADIQNEYLEQNGREERVDLRSFARQGKLEKPTIHEGPVIREMEARGIATDIGNYNRAVRKFNSFIQSIISQIRKLQEEIAEIVNRENEIDKVLADPNNLAVSELLLECADARKKERQDWHEGAKKKSNSKDFADIAHSISYASNKGIKTVGDLNSRLSILETECNKKEFKNRDIIENYKNIKAYEIALNSKKKYQDIHDAYMKIGWKSRKEKYYAEHKKELDAYNKAVRTIKAIEPKLNGPFEEQKKIYEYAYNDLKKELAPVKEELEELKKIKYFISKVMPAGTGGTAGDIFDDPDIESSNEPPSFKEQIKEAKHEPK